MNTSVIIADGNVALCSCVASKKKRNGISRSLFFTTHHTTPHHTTRKCFTRKMKMKKKKKRDMDPSDGRVEEKRGNNDGVCVASPSCNLSQFLIFPYCFIAPVPWSS